MTALQGKRHVRWNRSSRHGWNDREQKIVNKNAKYKLDQSIIEAYHYGLSHICTGNKKKHRPFPKDQKQSPLVARVYLLKI